jgi:hypothetical protein
VTRPAVNSRHSELLSSSVASSEKNAKWRSLLSDFVTLDLLVGEISEDTSTSVSIYQS